MGNISYSKQPNYEINKITFLEEVNAQSMNSIKNNMDLYLKKFRTNGFVGFKRLNATEEEQKEIFNIFCKNFNIIAENYGYSENHNLSIKKEKNKILKNNILVSWHYEHIENKVETLASCWNMTNFTCDNSCGVTLFANGEEIIDDFTDSEINFLKKCVVVTNHNNHEDKNYRTPIRESKINNSRVLRIDPSYIVEKLVSFDGRKPSVSEISQYMKIQRKFEQMLLPDSNHVKGWSWSKGDLLVIDLFRMCHAVLGGFEPQEREFIGIWGKDCL